LDLAQRIKKLARLQLVAMLGIVACLSYWQVIRAAHLRASPYNQRLAERARLVPRGSILTRDGQVLATDTTEGRFYPLGESCAHLTGYGAALGQTSKAGLESELELALAAVGPYEDRWRDLIRGKPRGHDVILTIDSRVQEVAWEGLRELTGAALAIDPRNGAVLALASSPSFDPNRIRESDVWKAVSARTDAPLLARPLRGLYRPGAVFKIVTLAAGLEAGVIRPDERLVCRGTWVNHGHKVTCWKQEGHGDLTPADALAQSCDIVFAKIAQRLGRERLRDWLGRLPQPAESLHLPQEAPRVPLLDEDAEASQELVQVSCGEDDLLVTPMCVALLACAFAEQGRWHEPYLVHQVIDAWGELVADHPETRQHRLTTAAVAQEVLEAMEQAVDRGTAGRGRIRGVRVAGKTGSAENPEGKAHAWFVGLAPVQEPRVVVVVLVENVGTGRGYAAPIGREIIRAALNVPRVAAGSGDRMGALAG